MRVGNLFRNLRSNRSIISSEKSAHTVRGILILLILLAGSFAEASQDAGAAPAATPEWMNRETYLTCGQDCLIMKGNEALSQEALYIVSYLGQLEGMKESERETELDRFCASSGESGNQCYRRFIQVQTLTLQRIRRAIMLNKDSVARLQSDATAGAPPVNSSREGDLRPQITQVESYDSLRKRYKEVDQRFQEKVLTPGWANGLPSQLDPNDFILFEEIERNPGQGDGEKFLVAKRGPDGQLMLDEKGYQEALKNFQKATGTLPNALIDSNKAAYGQGPKHFVGRRTEMTQAMEYAYRQSRNQFVDILNEQMEKSAPKSRQKPARRPSATATPQGGESGSASGASQVLAQGNSVNAAVAPRAPAQAGQSPALRPSAAPAVLSTEAAIDQPDSDAGREAQRQLAVQARGGEKASLPYQRGTVVQDRVIDGADSHRGRNIYTTYRPSDLQKEIDGFLSNIPDP